MPTEWVLLILLLAVLVAIALLLFFRSPSRLVSKQLWAGLVWFYDANGYWGPCCESCQIQYTMRRVFRSPDGLEYYELVCPVCFDSRADRAFTLQALIRLDQEMATLLKRHRAGVPITEGVNLAADFPEPRPS